MTRCGRFVCLLSCLAGRASAGGIEEIVVDSDAVLNRQTGTTASDIDMWRDIQSRESVSSVMRREASPSSQLEQRRRGASPRPHAGLAVRASGEVESIASLADGAVTEAQPATTTAAITAATTAAAVTTTTATTASTAAPGTLPPMTTQATSTQSTTSVSSTSSTTPVPGAPVNCAWSDWTQWTACSKTCGMGQRNRERTERQASQLGGAPCEGPAGNMQSCNTQACPVDCMWSAWGPWAGCTKTCNGGQNIRARIKAKKVENGGKDCTGSFNENRPCNLEACPVDCELDQWTQWGQCSRTCGGGTAQRTRGILASAANGGKPCNAHVEHSRDCNTGQCPRDCVWNMWSQWTECTSTCGDGKRTRSRTKRIAENSVGRPCDGEATASLPCASGECPVDCAWDDWAEWKPCSVTCGEGTMVRERTWFTERNGGKPCNGSRTDTLVCSQVRCPSAGTNGTGGTTGRSPGSSASGNSSSTSSDVGSSEPKVTGSFSLNVSDPTAFVNHPGTEEAICHAIAKSTRTPRSAINATITLGTAGSSLVDTSNTMPMTTSSKRASSVNIEYSINAAEVIRQTDPTADVNSAEELNAAMNSVKSGLDGVRTTGANAFAAQMVSELASRSVPGADGVTVTAMSEPAVATVTTSTTTAPTTTTEQTTTMQPATITPSMSNSTTDNGTDSNTTSSSTDDGNITNPTTIDGNITNPATINGNITNSTTINATIGQKASTTAMPATTGPCPTLKPTTSYIPGVTKVMGEIELNVSDVRGFMKGESVATGIAEVFAIEARVPLPSVTIEMSLAGMSLLEMQQGPNITATPTVTPPQNWGNVKIVWAIDVDAVVAQSDDGEKAGDTGSMVKLFSVSILNSLKQVTEADVDKKLRRVLKKHGYTWDFRLVQMSEPVVILPDRPVYPPWMSTTFGPFRPSQTRTVQGKLKMTIANPKAFADNPSAVEAMQAAISSITRVSKATIEIKIKVVPAEGVIKPAQPKAANTYSLLDHAASSVPPPSPVPAVNEHIEVTYRIDLNAAADSDTLEDPLLFSEFAKDIQEALISAGLQDVTHKVNEELQCRGVMTWATVFSLEAPSVEIGTTPPPHTRYSTTSTTVRWTPQPAPSTPMPQPTQVPASRAVAGEAFLKVTEAERFIDDRRSAEAVARAISGIARVHVSAMLVTLKKPTASAALLGMEDTEKKLRPTPKPKDGSLEDMLQPAQSVVAVWAINVAEAIYMNDQKSSNDAELEKTYANELLHDINEATAESVGKRFNKELTKLGAPAGIKVERLVKPVMGLLPRKIHTTTNSPGTAGGGRRSSRKKVVVEGEMSLDVADPETFMGNQAAVAAVVNTIAKSTGVPASSVTIRLLKQPAASLADGAAKLESNGPVKVAYNIDITSAQEASGGSGTVDDLAGKVSKSISTVDASVVSSTLNNELKASGVTATVTVSRVSPPTTKTLASSTGPASGGEGPAGVVEVEGIIQSNAQNGICLEAPSEGQEHPQPRMFACSGAKSEAWTYDFGTGTIKSKATSNCLNAVQGARVEVRACDQNDPGQSWDYDPLTGQVRNWDDLCLDAVDPTTENSRVQLIACDSKSPSQNWNVCEKSSARWPAHLGLFTGSVVALSIIFSAA